MTLTGTPQQITVATAKQGSFQSDNPQALFERTFGWSIPVATLPYWVKGVPAPELPKQLELTPEGQLGQLQQAGWHVSFDQYQSVGRYRLPRKLTLTRDTTRLRLIISRWDATTP